MSCIGKFLQQSLLVGLLTLFTVPVFAKNTILILGDSISAAYGMQPEEGWVTLLQNRLKKEGYAAEVINSSISGDTTSNGLARLPDLLRKYYPQVIIIELGGNDGLRGTQLFAIKQNLERMIVLSKQMGTKVLLLGVRLPPNYGGDYVKQFQAVFPELAKSYEIPLVQNMLQGIDTNKELMSDDGIHPTAGAQPLILDNVWPQLEPLLNK